MNAISRLTHTGRALVAGGAGFVATGGGTTLYVGHINGGLSGDGVTRADAITLSGGGNKQTTFVVFIGGITFTEIAALRFIAKQEEGENPMMTLLQEKQC